MYTVCIITERFREVNVQSGPLSEISVANIESIIHDAIDRILCPKVGKHRVRDGGKFSNTSCLLLRYKIQLQAFVRF